MRPGPPAAESRYLGRGVAAVCGIASLAAAFWFGPWSPVALDRPASLAAHGHPDQAIDAYLSLARGPALPAARSAALWHAGALAAVELRDPARAARILEELVSRFPDADQVSESWAKLGTIYESEGRPPALVAWAWEAAARARPADPEAARWLAEAGRARGDAGDADGAERLLRRAAAKDPDVAPSAWLNLGRLRLPTDPVLAYRCYDAALRAGADGDEAALARLGMATALEQMDQGDAALAELDDAAMDEEGDEDPALFRRRERLRARGY